jgi:competence protein ComFB
MIVHNIMEDIVRELTEEIFTDPELSGRDTFCSCYQCKNDVMCYVLNRINPIYIFTSRGASHFKMNYLDNLQRRADIAALIYKGIKKVVETKRPHFLHKNEAGDSEHHGTYYNFPTISGKVIDSLTFEPLGNIEISLLRNGSAVEMINPNWQNPYCTHSGTAGIFAFLPMPIEAPGENDEKTFELELAIDAPEYEQYRRYFEITVASSAEYREFYSYGSYFELEDVYLIPRSSE